MIKIKNKIINTRCFKGFRKSFLEKILSDVKGRNKSNYCCLVKTYHRWFISWKDLKEVKENMGSVHLYPRSDYPCNHTWFKHNLDRVNFLEECLKKF